LLNDSVSVINPHYKGGGGGRSLLCPSRIYLEGLIGNMHTLEIPGKPKVDMPPLFLLLRNMNRDLQGHYVTISNVGEQTQTFVLTPSPPVPPLLSGA
jgi:hypothetical protein